MQTDKIELSVIVIFHNMRREARRTLYSLSREYQKNINGLSYEVIAIDNGSKKPLDKNWITNLGDQFQYVFFKTRNKSPCKALNYGVKIARGKYVMLCIDGARILSPGILNLSTLATKTFESPFIYTIGMHIGHKPQNYLVEEKFTQTDEDNLLKTVDWKNDGYTLFDISSVALSSKQGYLSEITESNCFSIQKTVYEKLGGFDEKFTSPGGGLANLDFFNRINQTESIEPVSLLGEATFHQMHGGTATNVPLKNHPFKKMAKEYEKIRKKPYAPIYKQPMFLGKVHSKCIHLLTGYNTD